MHECVFLPDKMEIHPGSMDGTGLKTCATKDRRTVDTNLVRIDVVAWQHLLELLEFPPRFESDIVRHIHN